MDTALKASKGTSQISTEDYTEAMLNMLEDFSEEKARLEKTQSAILNILEDSSAEKMNLEGTQSAIINIFEACHMADRMLIYSAGRIVQEGAPANIIREPATEEVAALTSFAYYQTVTPEGYPD